MSEYKTLKDWFGAATRGDGSKFVDSYDRYFEPVFCDSDGDWIGLQENGKFIAYHTTDLKFRLWHPPKQKVKRWKWAFKNPGEHWQESTKFFDDNHADMQFPKDLCERKKLLYTETLFDE